MSCPGMAANKAPAPRKPLSAKDAKSFLDAVSAGHIEKVNHYLKRGANPSADSSKALHIALCSQFPKIAELLIASGARVEDVAKEVFASRRAPDWQIELVTAHFTPATVQSGLLFDALKYITAVRALLRAGADPNVEQRNKFESFSVLAAAIRGHSPEVAIALIDAGASPHWTLRLSPWRKPFDRDESVLVMACERPTNTPVVRRLVTAGAVVNPRQGVHPLTRAIDSGSLESAQYLLTQGADPVLANAGGMAMHRRQWRLVPDLLRHGANFPPDLAASYNAVPLEILGLLMRARVGWVLACHISPYRDHPEVPRGTPRDTVQAIMQAKAALVYPDMQPQKLL